MIKSKTTTSVSMSAAGLQAMSLLISTRVPAKWTKKYKSGKRVTSLKIEAQLPLNFHNSKQPSWLARSIILVRNSCIRINDSTRVPGLVRSSALLRSNFTVSRPFIRGQAGLCLGKRILAKSKICCRARISITIASNHMVEYRQVHLV